LEAMADSDGGGKRELLEPRLGAEGSREKLVRDLLTGKPTITAMGRSPLLDSVKDFLPKMAEAEVKLTSALNEEGGRERLNVENLNDEQEQVVEMDIALMRDKEEKKKGSWTSDSEADSTPSPSENSFTSDTDVSSSSSCSSSSSEDGDSREKKEPQGTKDTSEDSQRKRPLIEELPSPPRAKTPRQS